jgi:hypothetical protein
MYFLLCFVHDINLELTIFFLFIWFLFAAHDLHCLSFHLFFQTAGDLFIAWFVTPSFLLWLSRDLSNLSLLSGLPLR